MPRVNKTFNWTPKREQFCHEYVIDFNGTAAAIRAGYAKRAAKQQAHELLLLPPIQAKVSELAKQRQEDADIDATYVLSKAVKYLETSIMDFMVLPEEGGNKDPYFDFSKATDEQLKVIDSVEISQGKYGTRIKVGLPKKKEMLHLIGEHVKVNAFKGLDESGNPVDQNWVVTIVSADGSRKVIGPDT